MNILLLKLLLTPILITVATLAGRRWGPTVNGLLVGLPLTTGPLSFVLAHQYGSEFATRVAPGNLAGQVSLCVFCVAYSLVSRRRSWGISALVALASWLAATFAINRLAWLLLPASGVLLASIAVAVRLIPRHPTGPSDATPPAWDLPARIHPASRGGPRDDLLLASSSWSSGCAWSRWTLRRPTPSRPRRL